MPAETRLAYAGSPDAVSPWLLRAIAQSSARFVAVCCDDPAHAERAAAEFHARWPFHGIRTMLQESQPHGVIAAGPLAERAVAIRHCLAAGVPVLVAGLPTLPPGRTAAKNKAFVWSAAPGRFSPAGALVQRMLDSGKLGELLSISLSLTRCKSARGLGEAAWPVSHDALFEALDWITALAGPLRELFARGHPDGAIVATLVSHADVPISLRVYEHGRPESSGLSLDLRGVDGTHLSLDHHMRLRCRNGSRVLASHYPALGVSDPSIEFGHLGLINEFLRLVSEPDARPSAADWNSTAAAVQAVLSSLSRAAAVKLSHGKSVSAVT